MSWDNIPPVAYKFVVWDPCISGPMTTRWDGQGTVWDSSSTSWDGGATVWDDAREAFWVS